MRKNRKNPYRCQFGENRREPGHKFITFSDKKTVEKLSDKCYYGIGLKEGHWEYPGAKKRSRKMKEYFPVKQKWKSIVGDLLAKAATSMVLNRKTLFISIQSSTVRNELILRKSDVIQRLNDEMKKEVVTDIVYR